MADTILSDPGYLFVYDSDTECTGLYGAGKYAVSVYKACGAGGDIIEELHYNALRKIFPAPQIAGNLDDDLHIEGRFLDYAYFRAGYRDNGLLQQIFPNLGTELYDDWERLYGIKGNSDEDTTTRQNAILAAIRSRGALDTGYFEDLATTLGYTITITEGSALIFRVGDSTPPATQLPSALFDTTAMWTWYVEVSGVSSADDLEETFERLKPAWTQVVFTYSP